MPASVRPLLRVYDPDGSQRDRLTGEPFEIACLDHGAEYMPAATKFSAYHGGRECAWCESPAPRGLAILSRIPVSR